MYVNIAVIEEIEARERRITPERSVAAKLIEYCAKRHVVIADGAWQPTGVRAGASITEAPQSS